MNHREDEFSLLFGFAAEGNFGPEGELLDGAIAPA
jgi:hypothetical protein